VNFRSRFFIAACVLASTFVFSSAQAFAVAHTFSKSLPAPTGGFNSPWGVAVGTGGELFVSNKGGNGLDVYSGGSLEAELTVGTAGDGLFQVAVDHSSEAGDTSKGDVYVADFTAGKVIRLEYNPATKSTTEAGSIAVVEPRAVAVDSKGNVYISRSLVNAFEEEEFVVDKYDAKGALIKEKLIEGSLEASSMATDSSGDVYLASTLTSTGGVHVYDGETGTCLNSCAQIGLTERAGSVAVGSEGNIYEAELPEAGLTPSIAEQEIMVFEPNGTKVESFDPTHLVTGARGIAVSGTTVYVANTEGNEVAEFTAGPAKPLLTVKKTGNGEGTVTSTPAGINCGTECTHEFEENEEVKLEETPTSGSKFAGWAGACSGTGACEVTMSEAKEVEAKFTSEAIPFPLTVFIAGKGEVTSSPAGITCSTEECTNEFAGKVTLTEKASSGYEFVGWIGCKHVATTTCEVNVTAATEVTAVFLKEAIEGKEGPKGEPGTPGAKGTNGTNGKEGPAGKTGAQGSAGAAGSQGPAGPAGTQGPAGPAGSQGPAGQVQLVTCTKKGKKQHCTTKLVSGTVKFTTTGKSARATLSRHGAVYAAGMARVTHGRLSLRLTPLRRLRSGHYTLTLIGGAGRHQTIRTESFTLG
jgi:hypothetical protein